MNKDFLLGSWLVCPAEGTISYKEEKIRLEPKALSVLIVLARANGNVVSREQILDAVWKNQIVGDDVINSNIASLRKALGDDRKTNRFIQTVPKKGYKLVKDVEWIEPNLTAKPKLKTKAASSITSNWRWLAAIALSIIITVFVVMNQLPQNQSASDSDFSIAVLPFEVFSPEPELKFFADGLAEEMLHQLVANPQLKVMARTASFHYRNSDKNLSTIANELNVKYLIEGSVREYDKTLRITVQLIDAHNNFHLWSRVFDSKSGEIFKIQQQVGIAVSDILNTKSTKSASVYTRSHPESEQAYKYFLMAQSHMKVASVKSFEQALLLFEKALQLSPDYALAYTGKATVHLLLYQYKHINRDEAMSDAEAALEKAVQLDPEQAEAYAVKGLMFTYLKNYDKAEKFYLKALKIHPKMHLAHHNYSFMLWGQSRFKEAIQHAEIALSADPLSKQTYFLIGDSLASLAKFDAAIANYEHCQKVLPEFLSCHAGLANLYQIIGELDKAKTNLDRSASVAEPGNFWHNNTYASYLIHTGSYDAASKILNETTKQNPTDYFLLRTRWLLALAQNDVDSYIEYLEELVKSHPQDEDVLKFLALSAYWQKDYKLAVKRYEKILTNRPHFMDNLWDYSDGLSHEITLAVSYHKTGELDKKQKLLLQIEQHLNSFADQLNKIPGGLYFKAQYNDLVDHQQSKEKILTRLEQEWTLKWLIQKDPFWLK